MAAKSIYFYEYVDVGFSFSFNPIILRINSFTFLNNGIFCKLRQAFTMTNNMASSRLWKMLLHN